MEKIGNMRVRVNVVNSHSQTECASIKSEVVEKN